MNTLLIPYDELIYLNKWQKVLTERNIDLEKFVPVVNKGIVIINHLEFTFNFKERRVEFEYGKFKGGAAVSFAWNLLTNLYENYQIQPGVAIQGGTETDLMYRIVASFVQMNQFILDNSSVDGAVAVVNDDNSKIYTIYPSAVTDPEEYEKKKEKMNFPMGVEMVTKPLNPNIPIHEAIEEFMDDYWNTWIHEPIYALGGRTPKQVSQTNKGKQQLEDLFKTMRNSVSPIPMPMKAPFPENKIRRKLGMKVLKEV